MDQWETVKLSHGWRATITTVVGGKVAQFATMLIGEMSEEDAETHARATWADTRWLFERTDWAVCADGAYLCGDCESSERKRIADVDPTCPDDDQWRIIGRQTPEESDQCAHCGRAPAPSTVSKS